jgi:hypothetical protein
MRQRPGEPRAKATMRWDGAVLRSKSVPEASIGFPLWVEKSVAYQLTV